MLKFFLNLLTLALATRTTLGHVHSERLNGPVVGILTLPTSPNDPTFSKSSFSMIPGSYVKWLEQTGIRIIPLRYDMPRRVMRQMMGIMNGILITGGSTSLFHVHSKRCQFQRVLNPQAPCPSPYMSKIDFIFREAKKLNDKGKQFPIWGTCLGFEAMLFSLSHYTLKRKHIMSINHSLNLNFDPKYTDFMERYMDKELLKNISSEPLIYFNHKYAFTPEQIQANSFARENLEILSTTKLENNRTIVSMVKHKKYPFLGVQFHPEKIQFEHRSSVETNVSFDSIEASHRLAMMFFDQVKHNQNEIQNEKQLEALLIYNYPLYKSSGPYEQVYVFPRVFELMFRGTKATRKLKI